MKNWLIIKIQNKILDGTLHCEDYDNQDLYKFLILLKKDNQKLRPSELITKEEWVQVVKKSKRLSTLSIFLKRNYAMCKYLLGLDEMTGILLQFYNTII